jgi:hypothetical protein
MSYYGLEGVEVSIEGLPVEIFVAICAEDAVGGGGSRVRMSDFGWERGNLDTNRA